VIPVPDTSPPEYLPGLAPFALTARYWNDASWGAVPEETLIISGSDLLAPRLANAVVGKIAPLAAVNNALAIGQSYLTDGDSSALSAHPDQRDYAVYVPLIDAGSVVVGFGHALWPDGPVNQTLTIRRPFDPAPAPAHQRAAHIAAGNATAVLTQRIPGTADLPQLLSTHASIVDPLLTPVLRR
jgi:hypothetical protein